MLLLGQSADEKAAIMMQLLNMACCCVQVHRWWASFDARVMQPLFGGPREDAHAAPVAVLQPEGNLSAEEVPLILERRVSVGRANPPDVAHQIVQDSSAAALRVLYSRYPNTLRCPTDVAGCQSEQLSGGREVKHGAFMIPLFCAEASQSVVGVREQLHGYNAAVTPISQK